MLVEYILAIAFLEAMTQYKPQFVAPMPAKEQCMVEAAKRNAQEAEGLKELGDGAQFVCLKVERVST